MKTCLYVVAAIVAVTCVAAATGSAAPQSACVATLTLDSVYVITDTDPANADRWRVDAVASVNTVLGTATARRYADPGETAPIGATLVDQQVVGGLDAQVRLVLGDGSQVTELDPADGSSGVPPSDEGGYLLDSTQQSCSGVHVYAVGVGVSARPVGARGERDGFMWLSFTLTLHTT